LIWVGTNDGKMWNTRDGDTKWNDVSKNVTGMPAWGVVSRIEPSHFSGATAYVAVDHHLMDSREPYIFKTTDYGATWTRVNGDLPNKHPLSYVKAVAENPNKRGMLFAGTGHAFYYSTDDGAHWIEVSAGCRARRSRGWSSRSSFTTSSSRPTDAACMCSTTSRRSSRGRRRQPTPPRTCSRRDRPIGGRSAGAG
jgi:hypothetical protein